MSRLAGPLLYALAALAACRSEPPRELINVAFTISVDPDDYRTWDFDLGSCEDFAVDWIDERAVRETWMAVVREELAELGFEHVPAGTPDFVVSYQFWVDEAATSESEEARARGSIVLRDGDGRFLWRATRMAAVYPEQPRLGLEEAVRRFTADMLYYVTRISEKVGGR